MKWTHVLSTLVLRQAVFDFACGHPLLTSTAQKWKFKNGRTTRNQVKLQNKIHEFKTLQKPCLCKCANLKLRRPAFLWPFRGSQLRPKGKSNCHIKGLFCSGYITGPSTTRTLIVLLFPITFDGFNLKKSSRINI